MKHQDAARLSVEALVKECYGHCLKAAIEAQQGNKEFSSCNLDQSMTKFLVSIFHSNTIVERILGEYPKSLLAEERDMFATVQKEHRTSYGYFFLEFSMLLLSKVKSRIAAIHAYEHRAEFAKEWAASALKLVTNEHLNDKAKQIMKAEWNLMLGEYQYHCAGNSEKAYQKFLEFVKLSEDCDRTFLTRPFTKYLVFSYMTHFCVLDCGNFDAGVHFSKDCLTYVTNYYTHNESEWRLCLQNVLAKSFLLHAVVLAAAGHSGCALAYFEDALGALVAEDNNLQLIIMNKTAAVLFVLGDPHEAIGMYEQAVELTSLIKDSRKSFEVLAKFSLLDDGKAILETFRQMAFLVSLTREPDYPLESYVNNFFSALKKEHSLLKDEESEVLEVCVVCRENLLRDDAEVLLILLCFHCYHERCLKEIFEKDASFAVFCKEEECPIPKHLFCPACGTDLFRQSPFMQPVEEYVFNGFGLSHTEESCCIITNSDS